MFEYSYRVGNAPRRLLYEGRDFQHYFNLPSGDPNDDYKGKFDRFDNFVVVTSPDHLQAALGYFH